MKSLVFSILILGSIAFLPAQTFQDSISAYDFVVVAHRGGSRLAPENTLASIKKALSLGVDYIEIDVHQSKDSVVVVIHDKTLDRTTTGSGLVKDFTYSELSELDAGMYFGSEFEGERIPQLEEVIQLIDGRVKLLIEVKKDGRYYPDIEENILAIIRRNGAEEWCEILSFNDRVLKTFHSIAPDIPLNKLIVHKSSWLPGYLDIQPHLGGLGKYDYVDRICVYQKGARPHIIRRIHRMNKKALIWTVNGKKEILRFLEWGADGIITDRPDLIAKPQD